MNDCRKAPTDKRRSLVFDISVEGSFGDLKHLTQFFDLQLLLSIKLFQSLLVFLAQHWFSTP